MTRVFDLPSSLVKRAEELAREDGVSLDVWVTSALAQKIGAVKTAAEFFRRKSSGESGGIRGNPGESGDMIHIHSSFSRPAAHEESEVNPLADRFSSNPLIPLTKNLAADCTLIPPPGA
jgi:hypothetical protein